MKEMIKGLGKYVRKKKLEVNVEKTKMMVFNKRKRKSEENEWNWEGRKIERVKELKYLGYEEVSGDRGYINVGGRDLGMEGTTRGRESARKIFERETPDYRLQAESESGKESDKVWRRNGRKGRVQDTNGMLERKEKEHGEEGEREILPEKQVCQWISGKIKSKRKTDECRAEWKEQRYRQAKRREGIRGNSGVPGERECKKKKNNGDKEGAEYATYKERDTIEHTWNGCSEMRRRERKGRGEILNEDEREIGWMKKRNGKGGSEWKRKRWGTERKMFFTWRKCNSNNRRQQVAESV
jgi:hypothetical protein